MFKKNYTVKKNILCMNIQENNDLNPKNEYPNLYQINFYHVNKIWSRHDNKIHVLILIDKV